MKSNRGFTLVELIIVVAIIAVLATVLAPQYLQYVERSRESNDLQIATNYLDAAQVVLATGENTLDSEWYGFKWGYSTDNLNNMNMHIGTAPVTVSGMPSLSNTTRDPAVQQAIAEIMGWTNASGVIDAALIDRPESSSVQYKYAQENSFVFYVNLHTGEILVDRTISANWVNIVGVDAKLTN